MSKLYYTLKHLNFFGISLFLLIFLGSFLVKAQKTAEPWHPALKAKDYLRSENFVSSRADQNGSMQNYIRTIQKVRDSLREAAKNEAATERSFGDRNYYRHTQWYPLGPFVNNDSILARLGQACSIWVDSADFQTIYAGSNTGGIFATYDGGNNWTPLSDNYITTGVLAIDVDPEDKEHIYVGTGHWGFNRAYGEGVMESKDGGETWTHTGLNSGIMSAGFLVHDLKIHPKNNDTICALLDAEFRSSTSIYRSTNKGADWEQVFRRTNEELFDFVTTPARPNVIFAVGSLFLRSNDGGTTWKDYTHLFDLKPNHKIGRLSLAMSDKEPGLMLVFLESYDTVNPGNYDQRFFRSTNDGRYFRRVILDYAPFAGYWKMELQISPTDPSEFYLGGIWFFKYKFGIDTARYQEYPNHKYHKDVRDLAIFSRNGEDVLFMANDGGITRSDDGAVKWYDITRNGFQATQFHNICTSDKGSMVYGGPQDGNVCFYNYDNGEWTTETHMADAYDGMVDYNNPKFVYMVTLPPKLNRKNIFLLKSDDAGLSFNYRGVPDTTEQGKNGVPVAMHPTDPKIMFAGLKNLWKSTDKAESWQKISNFYQPNGNKLQSIEVSASNPDVICVSFENPNWNNDLEKVYITTDGGNRWTNITPMGSLSVQYASVSDILIHPKNPATIYLALDRTWEHKRIYVTHDGGRTWENFSDGIPSIPVNALRYFKGAEYDIMFAATDAGVYYRDEFMDSWQPFGEGLPLTIISDIEINYQRKKLVAGTFGRGLWEADLCLPLDDNATELTGSVTWPAGKNILSDLILMPGSKVTMTGTIEVGEGRHISILPGAELILNNARLTYNCIGLWEGIKLYGNPDYDSGKAQGKIIMQFGSSIENARIAVETFAIDDNGNIDSLKGGGIIYTHRAVFRNNLLSVDMKPTRGLNPSKFILTEFSVKNLLFPGENMKQLVRLNSNRGIQFISCIFRNDIPTNDLPIADRGTGIKAYNSSFLMYKIHPDSVPIGTASKPLFYQLRTGIDATVSSPGYSLSLDEVTLKNNYSGIYAAGYSNVYITNSSFEISPVKSTQILSKTITGLYLDHCSMFAVTGNIFRGPSFPGISSPMAGMIVNDCGPYNNMVANNSFTNLNYPALAQNRNRDLTGTHGLRYFFNRFSGNEYDITVTTDSIYSNNGIAYYQGASGSPYITPAGNRFSYNKIHRNSDFFNAGKTLIYSHYTNTQQAVKQMPLLHANILLIKSVSGMPTDSTYLPDWLLPEATDDSITFDTWVQTSGITGQQFMAYKDGGNTQDLINEIRQMNSDGAPELYKKLRKLDSQLSPVILKELLANPLFPNTMLIEVLVNNPVLFRDEDWYTQITNREPALPAYMIQRLSGGPFNFSGFELYEAAWHNTKAVKDYFFTASTNALSLEYTPPAIDAMEELLAKSDATISGKVMDAFYQFNLGNQEAAIDKLTGIRSELPDSSQYINQLLGLLDLNKELILNYADTLTEEQEQQLINLLHDGPCFIFAQNILKQYGKGIYDEPYILPSGNPSLAVYQMPPVEIKGSFVRVYPQPANEYMIIDYQYEEGFINGKLELTNLAGLRVFETQLNSPYGQKAIDVNNLLPGIYLMRLVSNGNVVYHAKIMIMH